MPIAWRNSCCIKVGLEPVVGSFPQVRFSVTVGSQYLNGPFFGPKTVAESLALIAPKLTMDQYADYLLAMNDLWPITDPEVGRQMSELLRRLGR